MKHKYLRHILISFLLVAATYHDALALQVTHLDRNEIVKGGDVSCLLQDHIGYLWIGTHNGLMCYDGYSVMQVDEERRASLRNGKLTVTSLQEDARHNIWVGTYSGYQLYDEQRCWKDADLALKDMGLPGDQTYQLHVSHEGDLCLITSDSIFLHTYDLGQTLRIPLPNALKIRPEYLSVTSFGHTIYVLIDHFLYSFDVRYHTWSHEELPKVTMPDLSDNQLLQLFGCTVDNAGGLWIYSFFSDHIFYRAREQAAWTTIRPSHNDADLSRSNNAIRGIVQTPDGRYWIATNHCGLFSFDLKGFTFQHPIPSGNVNCLLADNRGTVWMGFYKSGIAYIQPDRHQPNHAEQCGDVTALLTDASGNKWIGTDGNGLWMERPDGTLSKVDIPPYTITDMKCSPRDGSLWIGTYDHGIYQRRTDGTLRHFNRKNGTLPHDAVQRLAFDDDGDLWVAANFGASYYLSPDKSQYHLLYKPDGEPVISLSICDDHERRQMLMGTYYGLWQQDIGGEGRLTLGVRQNEIPFSEMMFMYIKEDDVRPFCWLGHRQGITVWDQEADTIYELTKNDGLSDNQIQTIMQDKEHRIWVATVNGLNTIEATRNNNGRWQFSIRNFSDCELLNPIPHNCNAGILTPDGELLIGTTRGYVAYPCSELLEAKSDVPTPFFTSIQAAGKHLPLAPTLHLKADEQPLHISIHTGNPLDAENIRFSYRVEGLNDAWVETRERNIDILSLPSGEYRLLVRAARAHGRWSEAQSLHLFIAPPFYRSWAMNLLYILLSAGLCLSVLAYYRRRQKRKVEAARQELMREQQVRLAEMKLQFFTNVSHDFRTPLTLILAPLKQLLKEEFTPSVRRRLELIDRNASQLLSQITALLDFRKLDLGAEKLRLNQQDLVHFLQEQCESFRDFAATRDIHLRVSGNRSRILLSFDEEKVRKIIFNLLSNAIKYSPDHADVRIDIQANTDDCTISVADLGPGIQDADKAHIFERFYQAEATHPQPGSGVGLHIASQYAKLHGGRMWVVDNEPRGAKFCFTLPYRNSADAAAPETTATTSTEPIDVASTVNVHSNRYQILFVDDNLDLCQFIKESLTDEFNIICANDGIEALELLKHQNNIHLVVSDVMMPRMNGLELCNQIKSHIEWSHIPVLLLTAKAADQSRLEGLQQGADDYLTKPFELEHLRLRIRKFIEWANRCHHQFDQLRDETVVSQITITPLDEKLLQRAIDLVEKNLADADFGVEQLCRKIGMSRSGLYKKLIAITGKSTNDFIRAIRMKHAKQLIEQRELQITEIAYAVGYNALKTFTENFKQEYGITPSEHARSLNR
ncbi:MAG: response regulator [Bacteroidales bacterium]|nr:response regulator [Bacteroidales bacterium]